ncbi:MAG: MFS transporter, partial [Chloroflexi bacterium]
MAQGWLVLQLTDSAFWVGMIAFIVGIPSLFLCPFGGLYADKLDRRRLMLLGHGISALLILLLATLVSTGVIAIW